jgi:hypothetical protein
MLMVEGPSAAYVRAASMEPFLLSLVSQCILNHTSAARPKVRQGHQRQPSRKVQHCKRHPSCSPCRTRCCLRMSKVP